ncbi:hypothetical protein ANCDUO_00674 [Ancylostoma duodenale]|uniref:Uncharacterized protein n=1 Tax=Ancylostoma duodenale TaxID=51022 RepID=A0A0C2HH85_9BILA|nr:hypothetical protein ANCDUO_00674 [Ancylostoma duodenale]
MGTTIVEKVGEKYHNCRKQQDLQYDSNGQQNIHNHIASQQTTGRPGGIYERGDHIGGKNTGWREQKTSNSTLANTGRQECVEKKGANMDNKRVVNTRRFDNKKDSVSEILKMDGMLNGGSQSKEGKTSNKRERNETKRPKDSGILKGDGSFMDKTMNQQEYVTVKGERYDTKRPKDSEILKGDGSFMDKTMNRQEYVIVKGERYDITRPKDSDILKGDGLFVDKTMNHQEYVIVKGERYDIKRPKDSATLFPSSSTFHGRTMYQSDYACFSRGSSRVSVFFSNFLFSSLASYSSGRELRIVLP